MALRRSSFMQKAYDEKVERKIPDEAYEAYNRQYVNSKSRGIEFQFSLQEWWAWWQIDDRWKDRGVGKGKLVMARKGDKGPYSPSNVYCCSHPQNLRDVDREVRSRSTKRCYERRVSAGKLHHFQVPGAKHPRAIPVMTPLGRFPSISQAAIAFGIDKQRAVRLVRDNIDGWMVEPVGDETIDR